MMGLQKQAKILTSYQQSTVLKFLETTRYEHRNKVAFLLSVKAGLRAKEIAYITWGMVTNSNGVIDNQIRLENFASKGCSGGVIWMNKDLQIALQNFQSLLNKLPHSNDKIFSTERNCSTSSQSIVNMFHKWYFQLGFVGCSSHSGRRTFITNAARKISTVGGSIKDVQLLARHSSLQMTQRYIEADIQAQKKVVQII